MWVTILCSMIAAAAAIVVAVIQAKGNKQKAKEQAETLAYRERKDKAEAAKEAEAERRRKADMEMQEARDKVLTTSANLSLVTSIAVAGGEVNGNVESAQKEYLAALDALDKVQGQLAREYLHLPS